MADQPVALALRPQTAIPHQARGQLLPAADEGADVDGAVETTALILKIEINSGTRIFLSRTIQPGLSRHISREGRARRACPKCNNPSEHLRVPTVVVVEALVLPPEVVSSLSRWTPPCHLLNPRPEAASEAARGGRLGLEVDVTCNRHAQTWDRCPAAQARVECRPLPYNGTYWPLQAALPRHRCANVQRNKLPYFTTPATALPLLMHAAATGSQTSSKSEEMLE